jgi:tripartite-type tricarboxylate transporter receptor subunit TctC
VPADRLKILREAFNKSVNDPAIKSDAEKRRLELDPATGEELESLAKEVMSSSPDVVQRVQKLLGK